MDCLLKINDRSLHPFLSLSLLSPISWSPPPTSSQLELNSRDKTCSDQEAVLSAILTMRKWPLFWNFPVTITSNLNLSLYKYECTKHLLFCNQDFGVQCSTPSPLYLFICEESHFTKFRTTNTLLSDIFWWVLIVLLVLVLGIKSTPSPKTWTRTGWA